MLPTTGPRGDPGLDGRSGSGPDGFPGSGGHPGPRGHTYVQTRLKHMGAHTDAHSCTLTSTIYTVKHNDDKGDNDDADIQYKDYYAVCFWAGSDGRDGDKGHRGVPGPVGDNGTPGPSGPAPITDLYGLPGDPGKLGEHHRDSAINSIKPTMQYLCRLCKKLLLLLQ